MVTGCHTLTLFNSTPLWLRDFPKFGQKAGILQIFSVIINYSGAKTAILHLNARKSNLCGAKTAVLHLK